MYQEKDKCYLLIKNLPDGLAYCKMVRDNTGKPVDYIFLEINSSFEALTGLLRDHIIGKKVTELYPGIKGLGFDWIGVFDQVAAIATGQRIHFQQYLDQQDRWYEITTYSDQPGYFATVFHDITERKQTEERERHFKQVLLAIRKVNQLIVQETDSECLIEQACKILTETLGYYNAWIVLFDEDKKVISVKANGFIDGYNLFEEQLKQGKYPLCIKKAFQKKGNIVIDSISDTCPDCPLYSGHVGRADLSGRIQYSDKLYGMLSCSIPREYANLEETSKLFIELAGDLGLALYKIALEEEHKQAEEELRESEEKWRSLVSILPDYVSLLDREDRFLFLNHYAEGFTEKEIIGSSVYQYLSTQSKEIFEKEIAECQNTGKIRKFEHTAMGDHGIMREYEDYLVPLLEKNKVTSTLVISRDITERKQAELLILVQRDLALAISSSHQLEEALPRCLDTILQLSEMDCGGIYLIDQANGDLNLICHRNLSPAFIKSVSHYKADSAYARLVLQGKPLFTRYSELDLPLKQDVFAEKLRAFTVVPFIFENRVIGCLNLASQKLEDVSEINRQVLKTAATLMGEGITRLQIEEELKLSYQDLQKAIKSTIQAIALILEKRDPYTAGHQKRMTKLACAIAEEISLPKDKIEGLYIAGIIHDIGKINVPTEILSKPGRLSEIEFSLIQTHPQVGSDLLKEMELPGEVSSIVLQHHERMDGSGYPSGLSGEAILLEARILAVADVVEAMASHRPYRPALGLDQALEEITKNKGKLYDPEVVDVCLKLFKEKGFKFD
jgi:PAS domain S-box-containing protein